MDRADVGANTLRWVGCIAVGLIATGCEELGPPGGSFADGTCSIGEVGPGEPLNWRELLQLGDEGPNPEPGSLIPATTLSRVVRDRRGRYWIGQDTEIKVFSADGEYLRTVGRPGEGPMEFGMAHPFHLDASGYVHVFDYVNARIAVIGEGFERVRDLTMPGVGMEMAALEDGTRYVLAAWIGEADRIGLPLHILADGEFTESFGVASGMGLGVDRYENERIVATHDHGSWRVFAVNEWSYEVEAWGVNGQRTGKVVGPTLDDGLRDWEESSWTLDNPPWNRIRDIKVDSSDRLWVLVQIRQSSQWFDNDGTLAGFVDGTSAIQLLEYFYGRLGDPLLRIWNLELDG